MARYLRERYKGGLAPQHIWLGTSIEDAKNAVRLNHLKAARASIKFVSFEPLIGPVGPVDLKGIDWVIVDGESGPRSRPIDEAWVLEIRGPVVLELKLTANCSSSPAEDWPTRN